MIGSRYRTGSRAGITTLVVAVYLIIGAFVAASTNGRRGAAMYITADVLEPPGVIAFLEAQRLLACRMRFGDIGSG